MLNNSQLKAKLHYIFNDFDEENTGRLNQDELLEFMELIGFRGINVELLIEAAGLDENEISFEDLSDFFGLGRASGRETMINIEISREIMELAIEALKTRKTENLSISTQHTDYDEKYEEDQLVNELRYGQ
mmetsp:Transcript_33054/g.27972  ORF Transcript_33054/g.27972 Transcript_33054/m.27972 type:complete len:131 (-) Transcript_33054:102-494(-)